MEEEAHRLTVAAKGIFEEVSQLGLPEGDVALLAAQGIHRLLQERQRLVDGIGLLHLPPTCQHAMMSQCDDMIMLNTIPC